MTAERAERPEYIAVGLIRRPHGLHGEVQVDILTDHPEARFKPGGTVWIAGPDLARSEPPGPVTIDTVRSHDRRLLIRFGGAADRDDAAALSGLSVYVPTTDAVPLDEDDSYYPHDLIGLAVVTTDGVPVGRVVDLMNAGASDILVVRGERQVLVPMIGDVIESIDVEGGRIVIVALAGLLDEG